MNDQIHFYFITAPDRTDLYWRPERKGYTTSLAEAGFYTEIEAKGIEAGKRGDKAIPLVTKRSELEHLRKQCEEDIERLDWMLGLCDALSCIHFGLFNMKHLCYDCFVDSGKSPEGVKLIAKGVIINKGGNKRNIHCDKCLKDFGFFIDMDKYESNSHINSTKT